MGRASSARGPMGLQGGIYAFLRYLSSVILFLVSEYYISISLLLPSLLYLLMVHSEVRE